MALTDTMGAPGVDRRAGPAAWLALIGWIVLSNIAGALGAIASINARDFYSALNTPPWSPPGWVFGPVWTTLYILMGIAAWLVWRERPADVPTASARKLGLQIFVLQLILNALWTWLFFTWRQGAVAFFEIISLALLILLTIQQFGRVSRAASLLLVPYIAWVCFATALTWSLWQRNPTIL